MPPWPLHDDLRGGAANGVGGAQIFQAERPIPPVDSTGRRIIVYHIVKYQVAAIDRTFSALADPTRRAVLLRLKDQPGLSVSQLAAPLSLKLPGLMKHLDVLSDAGLITRTKTGRTVSVTLAVEPMREAMAWLERYESLWTMSLDRLVTFVEEDGA